MRILHTADWHIGAKTDDLDRFPEQKETLKQVINYAKDYNVDMVLISGDIYDNLVPSAEDEELFYKTVVELSRNGNCAVVAIAGNHDDHKRLGNANIFADKFGIYLVGSLEEINIDTSRTDTNIYATRAGKGFIEFHTKQGEDCVLALLPYPSYYRFKEIKKEGQNFQDKVEEWLSYGFNEFRDDTINISMAHLLSFGLGLDNDDYLAYTTASSNISFVDQKVLHSKAHYTALGHLHSTIPVNKDKNIYYSGSLINQYFSTKNDEPTNIIIADITKDGVQNVTIQPLNVKLLKKFTVTSVSQAHKTLDKYPDDLVKIVIENVDALDGDIDNTEYTPYVTPTDLKNLRKQHPNLVTLSVITNEAKRTYDVTSKKDLTNAEIFTKFVRSKLGSDPEDDVKELFLSLMSEGLYEAD